MSLHFGYLTAPDACEVTVTCMCPSYARTVDLEVQAEGKVVISAVQHAFFHRYTSELTEEDAPAVVLIEFPWLFHIFCFDPDEL